MQIANDLGDLAQDRIAPDSGFVEYDGAVQLDDIDATFSLYELRVDIQTVLQFSSQTGRLRQEVSLHAVCDAELHGCILRCGAALGKPLHVLHGAYGASGLERAVEPCSCQLRARCAIGQVQIDLAAIHNKGIAGGVLGVQRHHACCCGRYCEKRH